MDEELKKLQGLLATATTNFTKQQDEIAALVTKNNDLETKLKGAIDKLEKGEDVAQEIEDLKNEISDVRSKTVQTVNADFATKEQKQVIRGLVGKSFGGLVKAAADTEGKSSISVKSIGDLVVDNFKALNITNATEGAEAVASILIRDILEPARERSPILGEIGAGAGLSRDSTQMVLRSYPSVQDGIENVAGVTIAETTTQTYATIKSQVAKINAKPRITDEAMLGTDVDVYNHLVGLLREELAITWAYKVYYGDGSDKNVRGILSSNRVDITNLTGEGFKPTIGAGARNVDHYPVVPTGVSGGLGATDAAIVDFFIKVKNALPTRYLAGAKWYMRRSVLEVVEKVRDADGHPIFIDSYREGGVPRIMGYPVLIDDTLPALAADSTPIIFGDIKLAFQMKPGDIQKMLVDPYSEDGCTVLKYDQEMFESMGLNDAILVVAATTNGPA